MAKALYSFGLADPIAADPPAASIEALLSSNPEASYRTPAVASALGISVQEANACLGAMFHRGAVVRDGELADDWTAVAGCVELELSYIAGGMDLLCDVAGRVRVGGGDARRLATRALRTTVQLAKYYGLVTMPALVHNCPMPDHDLARLARREVIRVPSDIAMRTTADVAVRGRFSAPVAD